jgi:peroxin-13
MSIKTLALAVAVAAGAIGFTSRADAQVVVEPSVSTSYYTPVGWGVTYSTPFVGVSVGTPLYSGYYSSYGYPYYSGYYGPYYGGGLYAGYGGYGYGRYGWAGRGWRR